MAAAPQSLTEFDAWLKEKYFSGAWQDAFFRSTVLLDRIKRKNQKLEGKKLVVPAHSGRNRAGGPRAESATLPSAYPQSVDQFTLTPTHQYWPVEVTGPAMDMTTSDAAAFANALDFELREAKRDMAEDINIQLYGDGTGALANVAAAGNGVTTVTLDETMYLEAGMPISIAPTTGSIITTAGVQDIVSVDHENSQIVLGTAVTVTTSHYIYRGSGDTTNTAPLARDNSVGGLLRVISNTEDYGGVTRSSNVWSQASEIDGTGGLDEDLVMRAFNTCTLRGGGKVSLVVLNEEQWRAFGIYLFGPRIWTNNVKRMDSGWQYIDHMGVPFVWDKHCPRDKAFFIDESTMYFGQVKEIGFMDHDGRILVRHATKDQYKAMLVWRVELCNTNPRANAVVENLPTGNGITG